MERCLACEADGERRYCRLMPPVVRALWWYVKSEFRSLVTPLLAANTDQLASLSRYGAGRSAEIPYKVSLITIGLASEAALHGWRPLIGLRYHPVTAVDRVV